MKGMVKNNMFLSLLNSKQKRMFLSLAYDLAMSDGDFCDDEIKLVESYFVEMNLEMPLEDADTNIEHVLHEFDKISSPKEKRIIIFELTGLAMSDNNYDAGERKIIKDAIKFFNLPHDFGDYCEEKINEYFKLQNELFDKILCL